MTARDLEFERTLVALLAYIKARKLEAHTTRAQSLIFRPVRIKRPRYPWLRR